MEDIEKMEVSGRSGEDKVDKTEEIKMSEGNGEEETKRMKWKRISKIEGIGRIVKKSKKEKWKK